MGIFRFQKLSTLHYLLALLAFIMTMAPAEPAIAASAKARQSGFNSPTEAVNRLVKAVKSNDNKALKKILGPGSENLISSGDPVTDQADRDRFLQLYVEKNSLDLKSSSKVTLTLGKDDFVFPIPLVRKGGTWVFDTRAGRAEILNRRIGNNELAAIEVLKSYLEAQREYVRKDHDGNGVLEFARKLNSTPGTRDGLYWEAGEGEEPSPFGPLVAKADCEGYGDQFRTETLKPFHGYYFKVLLKQGMNAEGGAFDYLANGRMVLGFAMAAYPARYRASGVMTFIVNQGGIIFQKDLGKTTARIAAEMTQFDPDKSWKRVEP
ncbi:MAG: DUF2950 domain-containing protein [Desulfuromonadaceae bacterium]